MIEGSCHCGAVRFELAQAPDAATDCNCSICRRLGALWAYHQRPEVTFTSGPDATFTYSHGDKMIFFHHCRTCGCTTHWTATDPAFQRMAVNARMLELGVLKGIRIRKLDGAETWTYPEEEASAKV